MKNRLLAACGLDCEKRPVYIASKNNDHELRAKTAKEFSELYKEYLGGYPIKPQDVNCSGCQSESNLFRGCKLCPIRKCCREKKFTTCAGCIEYPQCKTLNGFYSDPSLRHAKDNLDKLRLKD